MIRLAILAMLLAGCAQQVTRYGGTLHVHGPLTDEVADQFCAQVRHGDRVDLDSPGGIVRDATQMADCAARADVTTVIGRGHYCASGCVPVWDAGKPREAEQGARLGLHQASDPYGFQTTVLIDTMRKYGAPEDHIAMVRSTPNKSVSWMRMDGGKWEPLQ